MADQHLGVGLELARAMARAADLRKASDRHPRVRILTQWGDYADGITIVARVAARTNGELQAQSDLGVRHVPLADLDARAGELTDLVEDATAEILAAVAAAPVPEPRPSTAEDLDMEAYEALEMRATQGMFDVADELIGGEITGLSTTSAAEACASAALRVAALAAVAARIDQPDFNEMLGDAVRGLRNAQDQIRPPGSRTH